MRTVSLNTEKSATKNTFQLITLEIMKQSQRVIFQNKYINEKNKCSKNTN